MKTKQYAKLEIQNQGKMLKVKDIFSKYSTTFTNLRERTIKQLKVLPKGVVIKKKIKKWYYYYLVYRKGNKIFTDYIGKKKPKKLIEQIKKRQTLKKKLFEIEDNLYALGVARRISRGSAFRKRFEVFKRDNFTCQYCGRSVKRHKAVLVVDHIFPKKKGGKDDLSNFITSCTDCNLGKRDNLLTDKNKSS